MVSSWIQSGVSTDGLTRHNVRLLPNAPPTAECCITEWPRHQSSLFAKKDRSVREAIQCSLIWSCLYFEVGRAELFVFAYRHLRNIQAVVACELPHDPVCKVLTNTTYRTRSYKLEKSLYKY